MDKPPKYPGFTALLPPRVRYDKELPPNAKLLYAEISAMADVTGFCWASNRYLAALFGVSKRTVTELIARLQERGYVQTEVLRDEKNAVQERRLFITDTGLLHLPPIAKNRHTPIEENLHTPIEKNCAENDIKSKERIPPHNPPKGGRARRGVEHRAGAEWKPEDFEKLWKWYPGRPEQHSKRGNRQRAIRAWDRLHPDDALIEKIADALERQAASDEWNEGVGIPHLSTYLNGYGWEGWTDDG